MSIYFFQEDVSFTLPKKIKTKKWLSLIASEEGFLICNLNYIFCSDEFLYRMNSDYLNHKSYTDIITFDNSDAENTLEGDLFISIDRIKENAAHQKEEFLTEVRRVMSHGLFHLCGFKDKSKGDKEKMRSREAQALKLFQTI